MVRSAKTALICAIMSLLCVETFAAGSGSHSHGHQEVENAANIVTYVDSKDGVEAYLEVCDRKLPEKGKWTGFVVKCDLRAYFKDTSTGEIISVAKVAIRSTANHGQFGEARALERAADKKFGTYLLIKDRGQQHFLLIADIPGVGKRNFHFHHTFS